MTGVNILRDRLKPIPIDEKRIAQAIRELDHDDVAVREKASLALLEVGEVASTAVGRAMNDTNSPEMKTRCAQVLEVIDRPFPVLGIELLRRWRAIQVLERIGSKEAKEVLKMLATDSTSFRERRAAKAALERMDRRAKRQ